jgi:hypothetical protein
MQAIPAAWIRGLGRGEKHPLQKHINKASCYVGVHHLNANSSRPFMATFSFPDYAVQAVPEADRVSLMKLLQKNYTKSKKGHDYANLGMYGTAREAADRVDAFKRHIRDNYLAFFHAIVERGPPCVHYLGADHYNNPTLATPPRKSTPRYSRPHSYTTCATITCATSASTFTPPSSCAVVIA